MKNESTLKEISWKNTTAFRDLIVILVIGAFVFVLAWAFDAFETIVKWSTRYEEWEIDELVIVLVISVLSSVLGIWKAIRVEPNEALSG